MKGWSLKRAQDLLKEGKIRGLKVLENPNKDAEIGGRRVAKLFEKKSKEKNWMQEVLFSWCQERGLFLEEEYKFLAERKFRFDWAIPIIKLAIEYEGLMSEKSRHTTMSGYSKDTEKYNLATGAGWKVLRFTALNYKDLITELNRHK